MKLPTRRHLEAQAERLLRLFGIALVPQLVTISGHVDRSLIISAVVGAAEVVYREAFPPTARTAGYEAKAEAALDEALALVREISPAFPSVSPTVDRAAAAVQAGFDHLVSSGVIPAPVLSPVVPPKVPTETVDTGSGVVPVGAPVPVSVTGPDGTVTSVQVSPIPTS